MDRINNVIQNVLNLEILYEELNYLNSKDSERWAITFDKKDSIRVHFGRIIVFTMSDSELWISVNSELVDVNDQNEWSWDINGYPEYFLYKSLKIKNGYVSLPIETNWSKIKKAHFDIIDRIGENPRNLDSRTIENQDRFSFIQLNQISGKEFPIPKYLIDKEIERIISDNPNLEEIKLLKETEKERIVSTRIGQDKFRRDLMNTHCECMLCGLRTEKLLIASHIKKWSESNGNERLDPYNGFLLCSIHDRLFDSGLISFSDQGEIIISNHIKKDDLAKLNLKNIKIEVREDSKKYLSWHRENILIKKICA